MDSTERKLAPQPIQGETFNEILKELHQAVFERVPDETNPFLLSKLEREYIAYLLAIYYDCSICRDFHSTAVERWQKHDDVKPWQWNDKIKDTVLFLQTEKKNIPEFLWGAWVTSWLVFSKTIEARVPNIAHQFALAVGIARKDKELMKVAIASLKVAIPDHERLVSIVRDVDRVVIFMKAATSKNRTDEYLREVLISEEL